MPDYHFLSYGFDITIRLYTSITSGMSPGPAGMQVRYCTVQLTFSESKFHSGSESPPICPSFFLTTVHQRLASVSPSVCVLYMCRSPSLPAEQILKRTKLLVCTYSLVSLALCEGDRVIIVEGVLVRPEDAVVGVGGDASLPCLDAFHVWLLCWGIRYRWRSTQQASGVEDYILSALATSPGSPPDSHPTKFSPGKQLTDITSHPLINHRLLLTRSLFSSSHSFSPFVLSFHSTHFLPSHPGH